MGMVENEGGKDFTFVVCSTLASLGKSLTPECRMEMLLLRRWLLERREETQSASGFAIGWQEAVYSAQIIA